MIMCIVIVAFIIMAVVWIVHQTIMNTTSQVFIQIKMINKNNMEGGGKS